MTASSHKIISKRKRFKMVKLPISTFLVATLALIGFIVISFDQFSRQILREVNTNKALRRQLSNSSNNENLNHAERQLELVRKYWSASDKDLNDDKEPGEIGLIHLGKCGGTNLRRTLDLHQDSQIMKFRPYSFHLEFVKPKLGKYHIWIALIRDPIDRIMSSWVFEHPKNYPYKKDPRPHDFKDDLFECYETFNGLLTSGITNRSSRWKTTENNITENNITEYNITCPMLANDIFNEAPDQGYGMYHFQYNFDRALSPLLEVAKDKRIFVIRAESMLKDLNDVEAAIGGRNDTFESLVKYHHFRIPTAGLPRNERTLSDAAMKILCNVMCDEIQVYKGMCKAAENLSMLNYNEVINGVSRNCPKEANMDKCPEAPFWQLNKEQKKTLFDRYNGKYNFPYSGPKLRT